MMLTPLEWKWPSDPRLLADLRWSLTVLYSLNPPATADSGLPPPPAVLPTPAQAHDFLLFVQSRNARRKILSLQQQYRDHCAESRRGNGSLSPAAADDLDRDVAAPSHGGGIPMGSSWLACLAILCQVRSAVGDQEWLATPTERLFAAQTLLHRLQRNKLVDGIDADMEYPYDCNRQDALQWSFERTTQYLIQQYQEWLQQPFMHPEITTPAVAFRPAHQDEELLKGEITVIILAAMVYLEVAKSYPVVSAHAGPLVNTLATALATTALRLLYRSADDHYTIRDDPSPLEHHQEQQQQQQQSRSMGIVSLIKHAFDCIPEVHDRFAFRVALHICIGSIPEVVVGGTISRRISMDPRLIRAAIGDLRTVEVPMAWELLVHDAYVFANTNDIMELAILTTSERWARYVPLPTDWAHAIIPLVRKYLPTEHGKLALSYLLALAEGASLTVQQIVATSLGLSDESDCQKNTNKRQSCRSKKKKQVAIEQQSSDILCQHADKESFHRGELACHAVVSVWDVFQPVLHAALAASVHINSQIDGEGPLGYLAACAHACLPHIMRYPSTHHAVELFRVLTSSFQEMCTSPNKAARALSFEPLQNLHKTLLYVVREHGTVDVKLENIIIDFFSTCPLRLAAACGYPIGYFDDLAANSDEELEIERNDVRDIIRTVTGSGESGSTATAVAVHGPLHVSKKVLFNVLTACNEAVSEATQQGQLFSEKAAHAFSALAKPLNFIAKFVGNNGDLTKKILDMATSLLCQLCKVTIEAFHRGIATQLILPASRTVNIAVASLSPMLSRMFDQADWVDDGTLRAFIEVAILSIEYLPELAAESTLGRTQYDVRGTMRGPGGEDHVGCLALMRLVQGIKNARSTVIEVYGSYSTRLCHLYDQLKVMESERATGAFHGKGVAPESRRILLGVLCRIEMASQGKAGSMYALESLFTTAITTIASHKNESPSSAAYLYGMVESTFDLAAFSASASVSLFDFNKGSNSVKAQFMEALLNACTMGYREVTSSSNPCDVTVQWNRLRAAIFQLAHTSGTPDIPPRCAEMLQVLIKSECDASRYQCQAGPQSHSSIFNESIVSTECVPAGLFIRNLGEAILSCTNFVHPAALRALVDVRDMVLDTILHVCPEPVNFDDPRTTIAEAWLFAMNELTKGCNLDCSAESVLVDTCIAITTLLLMKSIAKNNDTQNNDLGMSLDGPQSLAITLFLTRLFQLGPSVLKAACNKAFSIVPVDVARLRSLQSDTEMYGLSIIGAALFRATQGALPPWAVEALPEVYSSLYSAVGKSPTRFRELMHLSMEVRLSVDVQHFGSVKSGQLLSGKFFYRMLPNAKTEFLRKTTQLCEADDAASWRRMKVLVKQVCGGKKKDTDFKQKPSFTSWSFGRV